MRFRMLISSALAAFAAMTAVTVAGTPAHAASTHTWQRLANCESSGRWHINTGNGYYGGLQISAGTWRGYGGRHFASLPHHATKHEQIKIAERIKRHQGWGAWPSCSRKIGVR